MNYLLRVRHDLFTRVTRRVPMCGVTHSRGWRDYVPNIHSFLPILVEIFVVWQHPSVAGFRGTVHPSPLKEASFSDIIFLVYYVPHIYRFLAIVVEKHVCY